MPLSEQEQRLLDEMERHLMRNDADVVAPRDGQSLSYRNIVYGTVLVLIGIVGLIVGVSSPFLVIGVVAFVIMVAGVVLAVTPARGATPRMPSEGAARNTPPSSSSASFMDRMNDRWDRRNDGR